MSLTLVQPHPQALVPETLDVLVHVPPASRLEVAVELRHVVPGVGDAAQAHDGHDAVDAGQRDAPGRGQVLDPQRDDLVGPVVEARRGDLLPEGGALAYGFLSGWYFLLSCL